MSPRLRVGLTGGIGSGKSTVQTIFVRLEVPVVDADQIAREVVAPGQPALRELVELLGPEILTGTGNLNRSRVRELVFGNTELRRRVEAILHPRIRKTMEDWVQNLETSYCVLSIPLLLETGQTDLVDRILVVDVPRELQIKRASARDHATPEEVARIIDAQLPREERLARADDILRNDTDLRSLENQIRRLHDLYLKLSNSHLPGREE